MSNDNTTAGTPNRNQGTRYVVPATYAASLASEVSESCSVHEEFMLASLQVAAFAERNREDQEQIDSVFA